MKYTFTFLLLFPFVISYSQLQMQHLSSGTLKNSSVRMRVNLSDTLELPFFDDFSNYTGIPDTLKWESGSGALVNRGLGINPVSLGNVSFDGLNEFGNPYDFRQNFPKGTADVLSTVPIDLSNLGVNDQVFISFFWQQGGFGEVPDEKQGDSLILEFKIPLTDSTFSWRVVWAIEAVDSLPTDTMYYEEVRLDDALYFRNDFQFRFRNRGTLSGGYDNWHLDYILFDANRFFGDRFYLDRTILSDNGRIFKNFTSIAIEQIDVDSFFYYLQDSISTKVKTMASVFSNYAIRTYFIEDSTNALIQFNDPNVAKPTAPYLRPSLDTFFLDQSAIDSFTIDKDKRYYFSQSSILFGHDDTITRNIDQRVNDTVVYTGTLAEYYSYDDGAPELGVGIRTPFGKVAQEFILYNKDTLTGIDIAFIPGESSITGTQIGIRIWSKLEKEIDPIIYGQDIIGAYSSGDSPFLRINFDSAVIVQDTIYIGWVQFDKTFLNVGYDMNNQFNEKIYTKIDVSRGWENEADFEYPGAMMIRPIFDTVSAPLAKGLNNTGGQKLISAEEYDVKIGPNPSQGSLTIVGECQKYFVFDIQGKIVIEGGERSDGDQIDLNALPNGSYIIKFVNEGMLKNKRLLIFK